MNCPREEGVLTSSSECDLPCGGRVSVCLSLGVVECVLPLGRRECIPLVVGEFDLTLGRECLPLVVGECDLPWGEGVHTSSCG